MVLQRLDDVRRAAYGVLVEIEAELVGASGGGRGLGGHGEHGGAGLEDTFGELRRAS
jgi:hypothetical protein